MKKLLFILLITTSFCYSQEEKRLALVIGNADYEKGVLKNPVNDAKLIAKALDSLGFEVLEYYNLTTQRQLKKAILEFGAKRDSANVGFVYYAGHGVQVNNENYLLPTQEEYTSQTEVIEYAVSVQSVLRALKSDSNQVNILVLDACRDNPFESNWNKTRSLKGDGLAKIPPPTGSLIAFSTDSGQTAADGEDNNSIYSLSLYKNMLLEDTSLDQVFRNVRADVLKQTNGNQRPVEATQLTGQTFYLNPGNYDDEFKAVALILEQETELTDALNILAPIINNKPENLRAQELLAESYIALENFSKALDTYDILIELDPNNTKYFRQKGFCYASINDLDKALEDYNKAVSVEPKNSINYEKRGDFYSDYLNDYDKALEDFNKGIALNPTDQELYFKIAEVYTKYFNKPKLALETLMKMLDFEALETILDSTYLYVDIADIYLIYLNDLENSLLFYKKEVERSPQSYYGYFKLAEYYVYNKDYIKAEINYIKALELAPENNNLNLSYINFKYINTSYQDVIELSKIAIEKDPKDPQGDYITALSYLKMENTMKALMSLTKSIDKIIDYSPEGYYISDLDGSRLDFSVVIMKRAQLYQNYKEFTMMCDDYKFALTLVKDEDLKTVILNKISTECNN